MRKICKLHLQGRCNFGWLCRNIHLKVKDDDDKDSSSEWSDCDDDVEICFGDATSANNLGSQPSTSNHVPSRGSGSKNFLDILNACNSSKRKNKDKGKINGVESFKPRAKNIFAKIYGGLDDIFDFTNLDGNSSDDSSSEDEYLIPELVPHFMLSMFHHISLQNKSSKREDPNVIKKQKIPKAGRSISTAGEVEPSTSGLNSNPSEEAPTNCKSCTKENKNAACASPKKIIEKNEGTCPYFLLGICRFGSACTFNSQKNCEPKSMETEELISSLQNTCLYYSRKICPLGSKCKYTTQNKVSMSQQINTEDAANDEAIGFSDSTASNGSEAGPSTSGYREICSYYSKGSCRFGNNCKYSHDDKTINKDDATTSSIVPNDVQKTCGICLEVVLEKHIDKRRFGILPNCTHCFCFDCIKTWRLNDEFQTKIRQGCPECRIHSDYVVSSKHWVETDVKEKFLDDYKCKMSKIHCKHFKRGKARCRFGNSCLYLHQLMSGRKVDLGSPRRSLISDDSDDDDALFQEFLNYMEEVDDMGFFYELTT